MCGGEGGCPGPWGCRLGVICGRWVLLVGVGCPLWVLGIVRGRWVVCRLWALGLLRVGCTSFCRVRSLLGVMSLLGVGSLLGVRSWLHAVVVLGLSWNERGGMGIPEVFTLPHLSLWNPEES